MGKQSADANVAMSLYKRATGYDAPDVDIKVIENQIVETLSVVKKFSRNRGVTLSYIVLTIG